MNFTIIYVDDDKFMRVFFATYFEKKFNIILCDSAYSAADYLKNHSLPDLMLLDLVLPEKDGATFLEEMKADSELSNIPVIILSGTDKSETRIKLFKMGAEDFIMKPFNPEELSLKIEKFLLKKQRLFNESSKIMNDTLK
ncbi:response regulator [Chondrinema litorale]|uniref:response regulator n=1 Tax=Chondrinema litorale TaxID=2994555 RepID=UPI002542BD7A|nr:response regulator [Chondrinema litorale]UZR99583.1 response regulator [Chondrinema litorale]